MNGSNVRKLTISSQKEIRHLFDTADRVLKSVGVTLLVSPTEDSFGRILIIIPKKVGSAPVRNKIRRQIKAIFYEEKLFTFGVNWAAIIRPSAVNLTFGELRSLFLKATTNIPSIIQKPHNQPTEM